MVRYGKERKETPQHKVAGLEWYTRGTCRERSECNSDCYTQWQSRQQKVQVRMREAKTPQHKVAGLEWYTRGTCRERSECNSDCYTQWQSRLRETKRCLRTTVLCTNTACWFCLLCPLRTISANAARLPLSLLAVSIRYSSPLGEDDKTAIKYSGF